MATRESSGMLYPLLSRIVRLGWLRKSKDSRYSATNAGRSVLVEVQNRLIELHGEVFPSP
jgi:DNA-binding PadR family transcriptional regulator